MTGWVDGPMLAFDTECTGVSVETDHILSASLVHITPDDKLGGCRKMADTVWINPGVPIPAGATAIHGITDQYIALNGKRPDEMLEAIVLVLKAVLEEETPLVGMNVVYDLTILDRNCRRHGVEPLSERVEVCPVIDIFVLDKAVDPYRKGSGMRKLEAICPLYRVEHGQAHDSEADAIAAARIAWRIGKMYRKLGKLTAVQVHTLQERWKLDQDDSFAAWLIRQGKEATGLDGQWPVRAYEPPLPVESITLDEAPEKAAALW